MKSVEISLACDVKVEYKSLQTVVAHTPELFTILTEKFHLQVWATVGLIVREIPHGATNCASSRWTAETHRGCDKLASTIKPTDASDVD